MPPRGASSKTPFCGLAQGNVWAEAELASLATHDFIAGIASQFNTAF